MPGRAPQLHPAGSAARSMLEEGNNEGAGSSNTTPYAWSRLHFRSRSSALREFRCRAGSRRRLLAPMRLPTYRASRNREGPIRRAFDSRTELPCQDAGNRPSQGQARLHGRGSLVTRPNTGAAGDPPHSSRTGCSATVMEVAAPANSHAAPHPDVGAHERLLVRVAAEANCGALAHGAVHAVRGGCPLSATVTVTPSASSRRSVAT
jgi:hypothetical protein